MDAGQPRHPGQRHVRLRAGVCRAVRHQHARHLLLQGHHAARPRFGNPTPRIAECPGGMLNAVGLQNPGVDAVIAHELPELRRRCFTSRSWRTSAVSRVEEYADVLRHGWTREEQVGCLEVNISCPNVHGGGMAFGTDAGGGGGGHARGQGRDDKPVYHEALAQRRRTSAAVAQAPARTPGADGVSLINTLLGMRIDLRTPPAAA